VNNVEIEAGTTYYYKVKAVSGTKKFTDSKYSSIVAVVLPIA
jgi:hypothetical protein